MVELSVKYDFQIETKGKSKYVCHTHSLFFFLGGGVVRSTSEVHMCNHGNIHKYWCFYLEWGNHGNTFL